MSRRFVVSYLSFPEVIFGFFLVGFLFCPSLSCLASGFLGAYGLRLVKCASSNGKEPDSLDDGVKSVEQLLKEKQRAELSARIASGEFTVEKAGYTSICVLDPTN